MLPITPEFSSHAALKNFAANNKIRTTEKEIPRSSRMDYSFTTGFLWYLVQGRCVVTRTTYQGQELALGSFHQPPELLIAGPLLLACLDAKNSKETADYDECVQIVTPRRESAVLEGFYFPDILSTLSQSRFSPDLLAHFFLSLSNQLDISFKQKAERAIQHATEGLHHRIARLLLDLAGDSHEIRMSQSELAVLLSTYREVTTELLTDLRTLGIVQTGRGLITILDKQKLQGVIDGTVTVLSRKKRLKENL